MVLLLLTTLLALGAPTTGDDASRVDAGPSDPRFLEAQAAMEAHAVDRVQAPLDALLAERPDHFGANNLLAHFLTTHRGVNAEDARVASLLERADAALVSSSSLLFAREGRCGALYCWERERPAYAAEAPERANQRALLLAHDASRAPRYVQRAQKIFDKVFTLLGEESAEEAEGGHMFNKCFHFMWTGMMNVVAASELAPNDAGVWQAATAHVLRLYARRTIDVMNPNTPGRFVRHAVRLGGKPAARVLAGSLDKVIAALGKSGAERGDVASVLEWRALCDDVLAGRPLRPSVHKVEHGPSVTEGPRRGDGLYAAEIGSSPILPRPSHLLEDVVGEDLTPPLGARGGSAGDGRLQRAMRTHSLWPSRISVVRQLPRRVKLPPTFNDELNAVAEKAYDKFRDGRLREDAGFAELERRDPPKASSDLNNGFFMEQIQEEYMPGVPQRSPAFAGSMAYLELQKVAQKMCIEHAVRSGAPRHQAAAEIAASKLYIWAAVYTNGTHHAHHTHEDSICSGVYYSRAENGSSPIFLTDPRGLRHLGANKHSSAKMQPAAPFHHDYAFFPTEGDMVLFPSWLVHHIPANPAPQSTFDAATGAHNKRRASRVVWAFNLYGEFECWSRSNV